MNEIKHLLFQRLETLGVESVSAAGLIRDVANCLSNDAAMALSEVNRRLHYLGWGDSQLDYHTFQLAIAWIENQDTAARASRTDLSSDATPRISEALA